MQKKYIVRLTEEERCELREVIKKLKGSSQKVRRAQILLKADIEGGNWTDQRIAEAFDCRTKTVEKGSSRHTGKKVPVQISPALRLTTGELLD